MTEPKLIVRDEKLYYHFTLNGKRIRKSLNLKDTQKNRNLVLTKIFPQLMNDIHSGEFFKKTIPTVDEYSDISFDNHRLTRKPMTTHDYKNVYKRHIQPYFGSKKLNDITVTDINNWKNTLYNEKGLSSKRVNDIRKVFSTILKDAILDEIISTNPISKSKPLPAHISKEIFPFRLSEIKKMIEHSVGQDRNIICTLFFTGIRTGELIGLKWTDIDFDKNTISIKRTIGRGQIGTPKTLSSIRTIDILDSLLPHLLNQYKITGLKSSYVFLNNIGTHYFDSSKLRDRMWMKVIENSGVQYRTIYQTRHTFCSLNLQNGEDILWIAKTLGHSSPKTTLEKYSKYIPRESKRCSVFDELIVDM